MNIVLDRTLTNGPLIVFYYSQRNTTRIYLHPGQLKINISHRDIDSFPAQKNMSSVLESLFNSKNISLNSFETDSSKLIVYT